MVESSNVSAEERVMILAGQTKLGYPLMPAIVSDKPEEDPPLIGTPRSFSTPDKAHGSVNHLPAVDGITVDMVKDYCENYFLNNQKDLYTELGDGLTPDVTFLQEWNGKTLVHYRIDTRTAMVSNRSYLLAYYFIHKPEEKKFIFVQSDYGTQDLRKTYKKEIGKDTIADCPINYLEVQETASGQLEMWHIVAENLNGMMPGFCKKAIVRRNSAFLHAIVQQVKKKVTKSAGPMLMTSSGFPDECFKFFTKETGNGELNPGYAPIKAAGDAALAEHPECFQLKTDIVASRKAMTELMLMAQKQVYPNWEDLEKKVDVEVVKVETLDGFISECWVIKPKDCGDGPKACMVYAHGGGGIFGEPLEQDRTFHHAAVTWGAIIIMPKYRLAPENKQPAGQLDFMHVFLHFHKNAAQYGIDANRMAISGESGGGIMCCGAARQLILRGEIDKVRAVFLHEPQISAHVLETKKEDQTKEEQGLDMMLDFKWAWGAHCTNFETQKDSWDPNPFPGRMPDEQLAQMPPTFLLTSEFDVQRRDALAFAQRLQKFGKLAGISDVAGYDHAWAFCGLCPDHGRFWAEYGAAFKAYTPAQEAPMLMSSAGFPDECFKYFTKETGTGELNPGYAPIKAAGDKAMMEHPECFTLKTDLEGARKNLTAAMTGAQQMTYANWEETEKKVDTQVVSVETEDSFVSECWVIKPKECGDGPLPCMVFAHGGAGIYGCPLEILRTWQHAAVMWKAICIIPKYRLAPENKQPAGQLDIMHAFLHFHKNAAEYGIDASRMAISGESGGGIQCCGAARQLILRGEIDKVRAVFLHEPQLSAHCLVTPKEEQTKEEQGLDMFVGFEWAWGTHCYDFETQKASWDPNVFPGRMPEEQVAQMPPTFMLTSEFDVQRRDALAFAQRLQKVGKLAGVSDVAGYDHFWAFTGMCPDHDRFWGEYGSAFNAYTAKQ